MKKLMMMSLFLFATIVVAWADNEKSISFEQLPIKIQTFVKSHFPNHEVALTKVEDGVFDKSYEVIFTNGDQLEFDKNGGWTELSCKNSEVPDVIVPKAISDYVVNNYKGSKILSIERDMYEYEINLSNGYEIKFNRRFKVIDIDR